MCFGAPFCTISSPNSDALKSELKLLSVRRLSQFVCDVYARSDPNSDLFQFGSVRSRVMCVCHLCACTNSDLAQFLASGVEARKGSLRVPLGGLALPMGWLSPSTSC